MRIYESPKSRRRTLTAISLVSLAFTVGAMVRWYRGDGSDVSTWYLMRASFSAFLTLFAVFWAVSVLWLLWARLASRY